MLVPYQNKDQGGDDKNSLGTCEKSQYSKYSRSGSGLGGGTNRSGLGGDDGSRKSVGPYSARESKGDLPPSSNDCTAISRRLFSHSSGNNLSRGVVGSRQQHHALEKNNNFDQQQRDTGGSGRVLSRRKSFVEVEQR
eukprot:CAMPEP_0172299258 /NCGR_PEP_ID=MMETSP1058-20130122/1618_1 /TAXON_ID=83371 /ORGANISM="Detonula confervacea, Strain CCMP 353" /LENGTH=136 /DNA_ID=CAMNT_0013008651 /DNA_START=130 /DNA_END=540 /DNA_ORIENTATION=+